MSIQPSEGASTATRPIRSNRRQMRSLKAHRAITAARRHNITLPSFRHKDIYLTLEAAGLYWDVESQQWGHIQK